MAEYIEREAAIKAIYDSDPNGIRRTLGFNVGQIEEALRAVPAVDVEKISDGYHTFADLYEQRLILSAALAKNNPHAWKSKRHEDGSVPFGGGWFIMGFDTDEGCYTYHYELKDWDLFQCKELDKGKPWDGHTSKDVRRLLSIPAADVAPVRWQPVLGYEGMSERLTFEGNFCEIARCKETRWGKHCPDGACSQRKVWERLKEYEDALFSDVAPVVHCKDCKYWQKFNDDMRRDGMCEALLNFHGAERNMTNEDFFCSYGERRERP